jgi:UDP:flavonoid glycosyltransferase YjiC (YdhE family)
MRILFTFAGGNGHFEPLVPIARAAEAAGHSVAVSGRPGMVPIIEAAGFTGFPSGPDFGDSDERLPLQTVDMELESRGLREWYGRRLARERAAALMTLFEAWKPDLIVCDEVDLGSMLAAEKIGLPYASVLVIAAGSFVSADFVGEALNEVRVEFGLPPDPDMLMLSRYLVLSPFPPSYRHPATPLPATAHSIRPAAFDAKGDQVPGWIAALPDRPTVYFTLGTVFDRESGDLFSRGLEGLRDLPINLIMTVGRHIDPAEFGPQPANVRIERYIPQAMLMPHCDLVVSHGGSGSVIGALAHGLPMVLIPMGADQPLNGARCKALGVGRVLDAVEATPTMIGEAVASVLRDASYRAAAERLRDEIAALPGADYAVRLLERLAGEKA